MVTRQQITAETAVSQKSPGHYYQQCMGPCYPCYLFDTKTVPQHLNYLIKLFKATIECFYFSDFRKTDLLAMEKRDIVSSSDKEASLETEVATICNLFLNVLGSEVNWPTQRT